ncbi:PAS domain-containing protein [Uliginosibacterium sp. sgz301328]|uniref:PAS domain-containing sensor histidine kinase n=1 Tax=Uliginosibacterium sp. sgz301328 TaxID=3243764 RepID=UPI00359F10EE
MTEQNWSAYAFMPALVRVTDAAGEAVYFNPAWTRFTGRDEASEFDGGWLHGVHPDDMSHLQACCIESLAQTAPYRLRYRLSHAEGGYRVVNERGAPWFDAQGEFGGLVSVATELGEDEAEHASERIAGACEQVMMLISHDLRSPLNGIQSWMHVLESRISQAPPIVTRALDGIRNGVRRQVVLLDDLQDAITVLSNRVTLRPLVIPLNAAVSVALTHLREQIEERQLKLETRLQAAHDKIQADPERVELLVGKLLHLAVKASVPGQALCVMTEDVGDMVRLTIADESRGVDPALLPILLDPFRQGDGEPIRSGGLDLAVARKLTQLQDGAFEAHTSAEGMRYVVSFPRQERG